MRITHYAQQAIKAAALNATTAAKDRHTSAASDAVRLHLSESGKTLSALSSVNDALHHVDKGLQQVQKALDAAQQATTDTERQAAQEQLVTARTQVAEAVQRQANHTKELPQDAQRLVRAPADGIPVPSATAEAVAAVANLDVANATSAQLEAAGKAVTTARHEVAAQANAVSKPLEQLTRKVTVLENAEAAISGERHQQAQERHQQALQVLQQVTQANGPLQTGLNLFA